MIWETIKDPRPRILGRSKFGPTEFDWDAQRIRLGRVWKASEAVLEGGDVFGRSHVASLDDDLGTNVTGINQQIPVKINPRLPLPVQQKLTELCSEISDIFATNLKSPRLTQLTKHSIDTGSTQPIKHKIRRVSPKVQTEINNQIDEMLQNGICRKSESPWNSPVILVTKKDGGIRFVIYYRTLNSMTKKDAYPLPNPRDIIDKLSGDQVFSKLDCCCVYWAVALEEKDIPKTAFSTPRGHFEMERMAFGLCHSQATYQRLIDRTLRNIGSTESYIDDILIHLSRIDQHINSLRQVFKRLRDAGIQLRADKCTSVSKK